MSSDSGTNVVKSLSRGTFLAGTGILSALIEEQLGWIGSYLTTLLQTEPHPAFVLWASLGVGVIVGDAVTSFLGGDITLGVVAGIKKGLIASSVGVVGVFLSDTGTGNSILHTISGSAPGVTLSPSVTLKIGTIWAGVVLSDYFIGKNFLPGILDLRRLARVAGVFSGTVLGTGVGVPILFEVFRASTGAFSVVLGSFWGAFWGAMYIGKKFHPGAIGGIAGGIVMAATVSLLGSLLGPAKTAYTVTLWAGAGISLAKVVPGVVVISLIVPRLPGIK